MRKVDRTGIPIPSVLSSGLCLTHFNSILANPVVNSGDSDFYRGITVGASGERVATVAIALKDLYNNKCAYCEKLCYDPEVEHFRPKKKVFAPKANARGYYWLCYEWTNLLPSCHECNSVTAKGNHFPILGARVKTHPVIGTPSVYDPTQSIFTSGTLSAERPLFINPEYCVDFKDHFDFLQSGKMVGISPEGKKTVEVLRLDSETLNGMRREIYNDLFADLQSIVLQHYRIINPETENWFEERIYDFVKKLVAKSLDHELSFTFFRKRLVNKIVYFFVEPFDAIYHVKLNDMIVRALDRL